MSRSGYNEDCDDQWAYIMYRGRVKSALRGARGQRCLREMVDALDKMENKRLIANELVRQGEVCAFGALGLQRGIDMTGIDPEDADTMAARFDVAPTLVREVVFMNDEASWHNETPEERWWRMRHWLTSEIKQS